jgi:hypothetical protein
VRIRGGRDPGAGRAAARAADPAVTLRAAQGSGKGLDALKAETQASQSQTASGPDPFIDVHTRVLAAKFVKNVCTLRKIFIEVFGRADQTEPYVDKG